MSNESSAERPIPLSEIIKGKINPVRARIISTAFNPILYQTDNELPQADACGISSCKPSACPHYRSELLHPQAETLVVLRRKNKIADDKRDEFKEKILNADPGSIDFKPVVEKSTADRRDYWKDKAFDEQNMEWNKATWEIIQNMIEPENSELEDVKKAFGAIGLNPDDTNQTETGLNAQIEQFRGKYFEGDSKVKEFVSDIARSCIEDGSVNISLVEKRLRAIDKLLGAFGKTDVTELVKEYAVSYSLLSQQREIKEIVAEAVFPYVSDPNPQPLLENPPVTQSEAEDETERTPVVETQPERKRGFLGFLGGLIPLAGLTGLLHLARPQESRSAVEGSTGREYGGDTLGGTATSGTAATDFYRYTDTGSEDREDSDTSRDESPDYVDVGAPDYGDIPRGGSQTGGFSGFGDVGQQQGGSTAEATETGGREGREDIGDQDIGPTDQATGTGGTTGYIDVGGQDYGSGEPSTDTGGFGGYKDIGAEDKSEDTDTDTDSSDGDYDGDGDGGD